MFRDLKEYQEIGKIYAEKVSKPAEVESDELVENQENRRKLSQQRTELNKGRVEKQFGFLKAKPRNLPDGQTSVRKSGVNDPRRKKNVTPEKKMSNIPVIDGPVNNPEYGKNMSRSKEDLNPKPKVEIEKKPEVSKFTKQGKPRTKAQMMAAKRIASGKTIQQVKDENKASMKAKAAERFAAFKAKRAEKKGGNVKPAPEEKSSGNKVTQTKSTEVPVNKKEAPVNKKTSSNSSALNVSSTKKNTQKNNSKFENNPRVKEFRKDVKDLKTTAKYGSTATIQTLDGKEYKPGDPGYEAELKKAKSMVKKSMQKNSYEPDAYDLVLEYLLSTGQAATIEEANYVMIEMDGVTINSIVKEFTE